MEKGELGNNEISFMVAQYIEHYRHTFGLNHESFEVRFLKQLLKSDEDLALIEKGNIDSLLGDINALTLRVRDSENTHLVVAKVFIDRIRDQGTNVYRSFQQQLVKNDKCQKKEKGNQAHFQHQMPTKKEDMPQVVHQEPQPSKLKQMFETVLDFILAPLELLMGKVFVYCNDEKGYLISGKIYCKGLGFTTLTEFGLWAYESAESGLQESEYKQIRCVCGEVNESYTTIRAEVNKKNKFRGHVSLRGIENYLLSKEEWLRQSKKQAKKKRTIKVGGIPLLLKEETLTRGSTCL